MDVDIQVQKKNPPMNEFEFVWPEKPISIINLNNRNQTQGAKRMNLIFIRTIPRQMKGVRNKKEKKVKRQHNESTRLN